MLGSCAGTLAGCVPNNLLAVNAGSKLKEMRSLNELYDVRLIATSEASSIFLCCHHVHGPEPLDTHTSHTAAWGYILAFARPTTRLICICELEMPRRVSRCFERADAAHYQYPLEIGNCCVCAPELFEQSRQSLCYLDPGQ